MTTTKQSSGSDHSDFSQNIFSPQQFILNQNHAKQSAQSLVKLEVNFKTLEKQFKSQFVFFFLFSANIISTAEIPKWWNIDCNQFACNGNFSHLKPKFKPKLIWKIALKKMFRYK